MIIVLYGLLVLLIQTKLFECHNERQGFDVHSVVSKNDLENARFRSFDGDDGPEVIDQMKTFEPSNYRSANKNQEQKLDSHTKHLDEKKSHHGENFFALPSELTSEIPKFRSIDKDLEQSDGKKSQSVDKFFVLTPELETQQPKFRSADAKGKDEEEFKNLKKFSMDDLNKQSTEEEKPVARKMTVPDNKREKDFIKFEEKDEDEHAQDDLGKIPERYKLFKKGPETPKF